MEKGKPTDGRVLKKVLIKEGLTRRLSFVYGYDIIIAGEKQAARSGVCFSREIEDFPYDLTSKRPMKSDKERWKRVFASVVGAG